MSNQPLTLPEFLLYLEKFVRDSPAYTKLNLQYKVMDSNVIVDISIKRD